MSQPPRRVQITAGDYPMKILWLDDYSRLHTDVIKAGDYLALPVEATLFSVVELRPGVKPNISNEPDSGI